MLARPNVVEERLVVGEHPALCDPMFGDPKDGHGAPLEGFAAASTLARGEDDRALVVGEHSVDGDLECRVTQLASPEEVVQHVISAPIFIRDRALTGHMPDDVIRQHRTHGLLLAAGIELILAIMKGADQLLVRMLAGHARAQRLTIVKVRTCCPDVPAPLIAVNTAR